MSKWDIDPQQVDFPIFVELYHEMLGWNTSWPQLRMAEWLQTSEKHKFRVLQGYRHMSKSHVAAGLYPVWRLMRDPNDTFLIVSAGAALAKRNSLFIRQAIQSFWLTEHLKPTDPELWQTNKFSVVRPRSDLHPSVAVTSVESSFTGAHAHYLICDDVEVEENVLTEDHREYLWKRVRSFMNLGNRHLFIGTPHDADTIYKKLEGSKNKYHFLKIPVMDKAGNPANPDVEIQGEVQDTEWIETKRNGLAWGEFQSQFMLEPVASYQTLFNLTLINTFEDELKVQDDWTDALHDVSYTYSVADRHFKDIVAYWDPASGLRGRDDSVLTIIGVTYEGEYYLLWAQALSPVEHGQSFEVQCEEVIAACKSHGLDKVSVEKNFSQTLASELKRVAKRKMTRMRVTEAHRDSTQNKERFIAKHLDPAIRTGKLWVKQFIWDNTPLKQQLTEFPKSKHDDYLDAMAGAIDILRAPKVHSSAGNVERPFRNTPKVKQVNAYN